MTTPAEPGAVVVTSGRLAPAVILVAVGFVEVGIVSALVGSLGDGFTVDGERTGAVGTTVAWLLLLPLALVLGVAVVVTLGALLRPTTETLSSQGYRRERGGRVVVDVRREQVTALRFRSARQATWHATDPEDRAPRGVGRSRLSNRIELASAAGAVEVFDGSRWRERVEVLRGWARERPELVSDDETREFLLAPATQTVTGSSGPVRTDPRKPGWAFGLIALAIRSRDPWAPFLPDAYGEYSAMWNGRYTAGRAPVRGSAIGLAARWLLLLLWVLPILFLVGMLVWIVVIVLQTGSVMDSFLDDDGSPESVAVGAPRA